MTGDFADWDFEELIIQPHPDLDDDDDDDLRLEPEDDDPRMDPAVRSDFDDPVMEEDMEEGTCGYTQTADGKKLNTPGGTRGMSALNRTNFMR